MENHVKAMRTERGLSQAALGERLGVSRQAINAIERGKHDPSLALAFALAAAFGVRIEDLFDPNAD